MADNLQNITDSLIDHIDKAIAKGSVTNQQVAAVLDFLNERLKNVDGGKYIRKDQPDFTNYLLEANGGLIVRKQEIVEAALMSITEEGEDALVEEFKSSSGGGTATLGELDNVLPSADMAPNGSILVKDEEVWSPVPPTVNELTDYENMLMPVFHKVLGKWTFISVSSIMGGIIPPVSVEMILDSGILDRDTLGNDSTGVVFVLGNSILDKDKL